MQELEQWKKDRDPIQLALNALENNFPELCTQLEDIKQGVEEDVAYAV